MKVSVIVPTYNEAGVIGECLESLAKKTYKSMEIIVVDDGSTDQTPEKIPNTVDVYKQNHKGAGAARNLGAKHAKGEVLVFVDADMIFDKDFIKNLIAPIENGEAIGTFSKEEYLANKDNLWAVCWNINRGLPRDRMHPTTYPDHQPVYRAILKSKFNEVGGFDEKAGYTDDWSLSKRLGVEAVVAKGAIFYHKNPDSLKDVFVQAKWMAKRAYKFGIFGGLIKAWLPIRLSLGFMLFKLVYGLGATMGVLEYFIFGKVAK